MANSNQLRATAVVMCLTPWPEQLVRDYSPMIPFLLIMFVMALGVVVDLTNANGALARWGAAWVGCGLALAVLAVVLGEDMYVAWWTFRPEPARLVAYYDSAGRATNGRLLFYDDQASALDEALDHVRHRAKAGRGNGDLHAALGLPSDQSQVDSAHVGGEPG
jgi:hypothetical protein